MRQKIPKTRQRRDSRRLLFPSDHLFDKINFPSFKSPNQTKPASSVRHPRLNTLSFELVPSPETFKTSPFLSQTTARHQPLSLSLSLHLIPNLVSLDTTPMPQVDLETLVCRGSDRKIACETVIGDDPSIVKPDLQEAPPSDLPADSFWLSKDQEFDWFDRNAFFERKASTKGISHSGNLNSNPSSQRFSLKSKASIIGLPKPQKSTYNRFRRNCRPANTRLFPKRSQPTGKSTVPETEPSSPKVSCIGRVRSKKDRSRRPRTSSGAVTTTSRGSKPGFWTSLKAILRFRCGENKIREVEASEPSTESSFSPPRRSVASACELSHPAREPMLELPSLAGLKQFSSGRRSDDWDCVDVHSEAVDNKAKTESSGCDSLWCRREAGPPKEIDTGRNWVSVGPATV